MQRIHLYTPEKARELTLIPKRDALAFVQMERILEHGAPLVLSDGETCLIVQADALSPVWVWTRTDVLPERMEEVLVSLSALREQRRLPSLITNQRFAFPASAAFQADILDKQGLIVYEMNELHPFTAEGNLIPGMEVPSEKAGEMIAKLAALDGDALSLQMQRDMGIAFVQSDQTFAWKTENGAVAAIAKAAPAGDRYTDIHTVYTEEAYRSRGYAKALLSEICEIIRSEGRIPMLYANRENAAANHIYRELGFAAKARLTVFHMKKK